MKNILSRTELALNVGNIEHLVLVNRLLELELQEINERLASSNARLNATGTQSDKGYFEGLKSEYLK